MGQAEPRIRFRYTTKKYNAAPKQAVPKKTRNHTIFSLIGESSSRTQNAAIPNKRIIAAGAPATPNPPPSSRKDTSPTRSDSICRNQGVAMKAMKIPMHTMTHDE